MVGKTVQVAQAMEDELDLISTTELLDMATDFRFKFRSISIGAVLGQLIKRALSSLNSANTISSQEPHTDEKPATDLQKDDAYALYDEKCCMLLTSLLSSATIDSRGLAGATYLLALLTAGSSKYAEKFRSKIISGCGIVRLVALLSADSISVCFNALLVIGSLLRHCPTVHAKLLRLGAIRKLAILFEQATDEPQQNLCVDAFLSLCGSDSPDLCQELLKAQCHKCLPEWIGGKTSERVWKKAISSINMLSRKDFLRNSILDMNLVKPLMCLMHRTASKELQLAGIAALENICCLEDCSTHLSQFLEHGGVCMLTEMVESTNDTEILLQVLQMLNTLAGVDTKARVEIAANVCCFQFLQDLILSDKNIVLQEDSVMHNEDTSGLTLSSSHAAAIELLFQVCNVELHRDKSFGTNARVLATTTGRVATSVGAN